MNSATFNQAPPELISFYHNAADRYTSLCRPAVTGDGLSLNRRRPADLASRQRTYQLVNYGRWDPAAIFLIPSPGGDPPDPTLPDDELGLTGLIDQFYLADPDDQDVPRAKVRPPRSRWSGISRRRRNR